MVKVIGPRDPKDPLAINTTSRSNNWSVELSPFYLGPIPLYNGMVAKKMENAWQYSKLYSEHADADGNPTDSYWSWAKEGWQSDKASRYPMGKGAKPLCSYWDGLKMTYIEARKKVYIPLYAKAVKQTGAFEKLRMLYEMNGEITLWDFDGYNHRSFGMSYEDVVNSEDRKCGHGFVLAMLLEKVI